MRAITKSGIVSIAVFILPIIITGFYKFIESSIGPVVFLYSIVGGILLGIAWTKTLWKWNRFVALVLGVVIGVIAMVLLVNCFIGITSAMGEMDYDLM